MAEYLFARPEHRADTIDFINYVFSQAHQPHDFKALIPKVYADGRGYESIHAIALEDAHVRGCVAQLPISSVVAGQPLKVGYIGSVSSYPYTRGAGHMKRLMAMQIERAADTGVDIMMLGGQRQRYQYFGFTPCGAGYSYTILPQNVRHALANVDAGDVTFLPLSNEDMDTVAKAQALYEKQLIHGSRPLDDFAIITRTWNMQPMAVMIGGAFAGYMITNGGSISELILENPAIQLPKAIKAWMTEKALKSLTVSVAPYDTAVNRALAAFAEDYRLANSEHIRIVRLKNVLRAYLSLKNAVQPLSDGQLVLEGVDCGKVKIHIAGGTISVTDTGEPADAVLSRLELQAFLFASNRFAAPVIAAPADWFPLPLYQPTADNF